MVGRAPSRARTTLPDLTARGAGPGVHGAARASAGSSAGPLMPWSSSSERWSVRYRGRGALLRSRLDPAAPRPHAARLQRAGVARPCGARLGTAEEGGYVTWVRRAFGPFWGSGRWWSGLNSFVDVAVLYPALFVEYSGSGGGDAGRRASRGPGLIWNAHRAQHRPRAPRGLERGRPRRVRAWRRGAVHRRRCHSGRACAVAALDRRGRVSSRAWARAGRHDVELFRLGTPSTCLGRCAAPRRTSGRALFWGLPLIALA